MIAALVAVLALAVVGCCKDDDEHPGAGGSGTGGAGGSEPEVVEEHNILVGHAWRYYFTKVTAGKETVMEGRFSFVSDTAGEFYEYVEIVGVGSHESTFKFSYVFNDSTYIVNYTIKSSGKSGWLSYDPDEDLIIASDGTEYEKVY